MNAGQAVSTSDLQEQRCRQGEWGKRNVKLILPATDHMARTVRRMTSKTNKILLNKGLGA